MYMNDPAAATTNKAVRLYRKKTNRPNNIASIAINNTYSMRWPILFINYIITPGLITNHILTIITAKNTK